MRSNLKSEGCFFPKFSRYSPRRRNQKVGFDSSDLDVYGATMLILHEAPESVFGRKKDLIAFLSAKLQKQFFRGGVNGGRILR